jgi:hypothetical protein
MWLGAPDAARSAQRRTQNRHPNLSYLAPKGETPPCGGWPRCAPLRWMAPLRPGPVDPTHPNFHAFALTIGRRPRMAGGPLRPTAAPG